MGELVDDAVQGLVRHGLALEATPGEHDRARVTRDLIETTTDQHRLAHARAAVHIDHTRATRGERAISRTQGDKLRGAPEERGVRCAAQRRLRRLQGERVEERKHRLRIGSLRWVALNQRVTQLDQVGGQVG